MDLYEELGDHPIAETLRAKGIDSVEKLANQYSEAQKYISTGRKGEIPGQGSTKEEWAEFRKAMGVPETPDGYEIGDRGEFSEKAKKLRDAAHEAGVTPDQFSKIMDATQATFHVDKQKVGEELQQLHKQYEEEGRKKFGADFEEKAAEAKRAFDQLLDGDDKLREALDSTGLTSHPGVLELFSRLYGFIGGQGMPEDQGIEGLSEDERERKLVEMIDEARSLAGSDAFNNVKNGDHSKTVTRYSQIQQLLRESGIGGDNDGIISSQAAQQLVKKVRGYV